MVYTGQKIKAKIDYETAFKGTASSTDGEHDLPIGIGARITNFSARNNIERAYTIGSRLSADYLPLRFEGDVSIEMTMSEIYWFDLILHNTGNPLEIGTSIKSFKVSVQYPDNFYRLAEGVVVNRATITARAGDPVTVRLDCIYASESKVSGSISEPSLSTRPFTFAGGTVDFGGLSTIIQNAEITINNNAELLWALGDRAPIDAVLKQLELEGRMSIYGDSALADVLDSFYVTNDVNTMSITLTFIDLVGENNGGRKVEIVLSDAVINEVPHSVVANETIVADVVFYAKNITVTTYTHDGTGWVQDT